MASKIRKAEWIMIIIMAIGVIIQAISYLTGLVNKMDSIAITSIMLLIISGACVAYYVMLMREVIGELKRKRKKLDEEGKKLTEEIEAEKEQLRKEVEIKKETLKKDVESEKTRLMAEVEVEKKKLQELQKEYTWMDLNDLDGFLSVFKALITPYSDKNIPMTTVNGLIANNRSKIQYPTFVIDCTNIFNDTIKLESEMEEAIKKTTNQRKDYIKLRLKFNGQVKDICFHVANICEIIKIDMNNMQRKKYNGYRGRFNAFLDSYEIYNERMSDKYGNDGYPSFNRLAEMELMDEKKV